MITYDLSVLATMSAVRQLSCDNMELPGKVLALFTEGFAVRDFIQAVRDNPFLYYGEVMTNDRPTTLGAIRFSLASYCGNP